MFDFPTCRFNLLRRLQTRQPTAYLIGQLAHPPGDSLQMSFAVNPKIFKDSCGVSFLIDAQIRFNGLLVHPVAILADVE